jgi:iron(III) transport system substrate-binding protein
MIRIRTVGSLFCTALLGAGLASAATDALSGGGQAHAAEGEVNVYSLRQPFLIDPMLDAFTTETGIKVNVVFAKKGVIERMKAEGANSPADVILTVDIGRLNDAVDADVVATVKDQVIDENLPSAFRDPEGRWFGLTTRARIIYASKDRVKPGEITSYEQLADPKWKGRICTRSGKHPYNVALFAAMIGHYGEAKAEQWLASVKENLARKPQGNDRAQVKAIKEGECDIAVGNSYYYGNMLDNEDQKPWADAVSLVFPTIADGGTHVNVSGMAMAKNAPNPDNALKLMRYLTGESAQRMYAELNYEYPVNPTVPWSAKVESWGSFTPDDLSLAAIAELRDEAIKMADRVDYDG